MEAGTHMTPEERRRLAEKFRSLRDAIAARNPKNLKDYGILLYGGEVLTLTDITNLITELEA